MRQILNFFKTKSSIILLVLLFLATSLYAQNINDYLEFFDSPFVVTLDETMVSVRTNTMLRESQINVELTKLLEAFKFYLERNRMSVESFFEGREALVLSFRDTNNRAVMLRFEVEDFKYILFDELRQLDTLESIAPPPESKVFQQRR